MNRRSRDVQLVRPDTPEMFGNQALYNKQVDRYAMSARTGGVDDAQVCSDRRQGCRTEGELPVEVARFRMPADAGGSCTGASTPHTLAYRYLSEGAVQPGSPFSSVEM